MTTKASPGPTSQDAQTLGILLAGYVRREKEEGSLGWDASSAVLCVWPLSPLGVEEPGRAG